MYAVIGAVDGDDNGGDIGCVLVVSDVDVVGESERFTRGEVIEVLRAGVEGPVERGFCVGDGPSVELEHGEKI